MSICFVAEASCSFVGFGLLLLPPAAVVVAAACSHEHRKRGGDHRQQRDSPRTYLHDFPPESMCFVHLFSPAVTRPSAPPRSGTRRSGRPGRRRAAAPPLGTAGAGPRRGRRTSGTAS